MEYVLNFTPDSELTPIDIVSDITGLTYDEIRSVCDVVNIDWICENESTTC